MKDAIGYSVSEFDPIRSVATVRFQVSGSRSLEPSVRRAGRASLVFALPQLGTLLH